MDFSSGKEETLALNELLFELSSCSSWSSFYDFLASCVVSILLSSMGAALSDLLSSSTTDVVTV